MSDRYSQIIVDRLRFLCNQRGLSVYKLSMMSRISYSTLDNLMNRHTYNPTIRTLHKIASALSMTVSELLDFDELNEFSFDED